MKPRTLLLSTLAVWVLVEILIYALLVPQVLSLSGFAYVSAVLLVLVIVAIVKWRQSEPAQIIEDVLYDVEHPKIGQKSQP